MQSTKIKLSKKSKVLLFSSFVSLSSKHSKINFSLEKENDGRLSFLDINVFREKEKFVANVYCKNL